MGRRKRERKLLEAAALGSVEKVRKVLRRASPESTHDARGSSSDSDDNTKQHSKKRKYGSSGGSSSDSDSVKKKRDKGRKEEVERETREDRRDHRQRRRRGRKKKVVDVNCTDYDGWSPLHHAAHGGSQEVLLYLLRAGAQVNLPNSKGEAPLHLAAKKGLSNVISALRKAGGDMNLKNPAGLTPMDYVKDKLRDIHGNDSQRTFDERLDDEREGWGVWGDETQDATANGLGSRSGGWDWFGEERTHCAGLGSREAGNCDLKEDDHWKDEIAEEMRRRRRKQQQDAEEAFLENARQEWAEMKRKRAAKEQQSHRILEEEMKKDQAWRKSVTSRREHDLKKTYEAGWKVFLESCHVGITMGDVPFPVERGKEASLKELLLSDMPEAEHRKRIREEVLRWHPDKFLQRFGRRLLLQEREAILSRVNEISQAVQDVYFSLAK